MSPESQPGKISKEKEMPLSLVIGIPLENEEIRPETHVFYFRILALLEHKARKHGSLKSRLLVIIETKLYSRDSWAVICLKNTM